MDSRKVDRSLVVLDCFGLFAQDPFVTYFLRHFGEKGLAMKNGYCEGADKGEVGFNDLLARISADLNIDESELRKEFKEICFLDEKMVALTKKLRERHCVYMLSNCIEGAQEFFFGEKGLSSLFDTMYRSYELGLIKPESPIYELVVREAKGKFDRIVFLDDNPANLPPAEKAGMDSILFLSPEQAEEELTEKGYL